MGQSEILKKQALLLNEINFLLNKDKEQINIAKSSQLTNSTS